MLDSEAIVNYVMENLKDKIDNKEIYLFGRSLGGAVGIYITNYLKPKIKGLIIENTFSSLGELIDKIFPFLKYIKTYMLKNHWPSINRINDINIPILFYMSGKDELIPLEHMQRLYSKANLAEFKSKFFIPNGTHNDGWLIAGKKYFIHFAKFMKKCQSDLDHLNLSLEDFEYENKDKDIKETNKGLSEKSHEINYNKDNEKENDYSINDTNYDDFTKISKEDYNTINSIDNYNEEEDSLIKNKKNE
jgi:hypothetical protein